MSEHTDSSGTVSRVEIEELAALFDAWEFALFPTWNEAKIAQLRYEEREREIYERVQKQFKSLHYSDFRVKLRAECRRFLRRN